MYVDYLNFAQYNITDIRSENNKFSKNILTKPFN